MNLPEWLPELLEVLWLRNYNTRLVVLSTMLLGLASGLIGSFLLLRKRALMSDTLAHACLPGIGFMFVGLTLAGRDGRVLPWLLLGATLSGYLGVAWVTAIRSTTKINDDAAMGIVLSVFFGVGVVVLSIAQSMGGSAAGLESFVFGKTASMIRQDYLLLLRVTAGIILLSLLLHKEFTLLCFNEEFARSLGWPVHALDLALMALVTAVTVVGLQAVGLILIIAFMIIPAASARFWTDRYRLMWIISGLLGAVSGWIGATLSAWMPRLPAGAVIVLVSGALFVLSLLFGGARGVLHSLHRHRRLRRRVGRQHLLRAVYELLEQDHGARNQPVPLERIQAKRSWSHVELRRLLARARREDHVERRNDGNIQLTESGYGEAARTTRNHRLWELYLIRFADVATRHVDRDADKVEHVLGPELVRQLEAELDSPAAETRVPASPHGWSEKEISG